MHIAQLYCIGWAIVTALSVRLSVCPSVCPIMYCAKTVWARITKLGHRNGLEPQSLLTQRHQNGATPRGRYVMKGMKKNLGFTKIFSPAMRIFMLLFTFSTFFAYFKKYVFFFLKPTFLVRRFVASPNSRWPYNCDKLCLPHCSYVCGAWRSCCQQLLAACSRGGI